MKIKDSNKVVTILRDPSGRGENLPIIHRTLKEIKFKPDVETRHHQRNTHLSLYNTKNAFDPYGQTLADLEDLEKVYHVVRNKLNLPEPENSQNFIVTKKKLTNNPEDFAKNIDNHYSKMSRIKGNTSYVEIFGFDFNPEDDQTSGAILKAKERLKEEREKKRSKRSFQYKEENTPTQRVQNQPFISFHQTRALFKKDLRKQNQLKRILKTNQDNLKAVKASHYIMSYGEPDNSTSFITSVQESSFLSHAHDESFQRSHLISLVDGSLIKPYAKLPSLREKVEAKRNILKQQRDTEFQLKSDMQKLTKMLEEITHKRAPKIIKKNSQGDPVYRRSRSNVRHDTKLKKKVGSQEKSPKRNRFSSQADSEMDIDITDRSLSSEKNSKQSSHDSLSKVNIVSKQISIKQEKVQQEQQNKSFEDNRSITKHASLKPKAQEPDSGSIVEKEKSIKKKSIKKKFHAYYQKKISGDEYYMGTDQMSEQSQKTDDKRVKPNITKRNQSIDNSMSGKTRSNASYHHGSVIPETPTESGSNNAKFTEDSSVLDGKQNKALKTVQEHKETSKKVNFENTEQNESNVIKAANDFIRRRKDLNNSLEETLKVLERDRPRSNKLRYDSYTPVNVKNPKLYPGDIRRIAERTRKRNYDELKQYIGWYNKLLELVIENELLLEENALQPCYIICDIIKEAIEDGEQPQKKHFYQIAGLLQSQGELSKTIRILVNELKSKLNINEHEVPYHLQF